MLQTRSDRRSWGKDDAQRGLEIRFGAAPISRCLTPPCLTPKEMGKQKHPEQQLDEVAVLIISFNGSLQTVGQPELFQCTVGTMHKRSFLSVLVADQCSCSAPLTYTPPNSLKGSGLSCTPWSTLFVGIDIDLSSSTRQRLLIIPVYHINHGDIAQENV